MSIVPMDLKSTFRKGSTISGAGFVIPPFHIRIYILRIINPHILAVEHFYTVDYKSTGTILPKKRQDFSRSKVSLLIVQTCMKPSLTQSSETKAFMMADNFHRGERFRSLPLTGQKSAVSASKVADFATATRRLLKNGRQTCHTM